MKIIFSRKGFDSGSGGVPSPIFPDKRMVSLPIPDKHSPVPYKELQWDGLNVGDIVEDLTKGKIPAHYKAHLDPDLSSASLQRQNGWQPLFGQVGASQGHLRKQGVGPGDLFVFFGLFQDVIRENGRWRFNQRCLPKHVMWGWFQIEAAIAVEKVDRTKIKWALYHPHFHREPNPSNTVYFAKDRLDISGTAGKALAGAGIFPKFLNTLQLTAPQSPVSVWKLPHWIFPGDTALPLSYHTNRERWERQVDHTLLQTVGRGQEFVLDCAYYPESIQWIGDLLGSGVGVMADQALRIIKEVRNGNIR